MEKIETYFESSVGYFAFSEIGDERVEENGKELNGQKRGEMLLLKESRPEDDEIVRVGEKSSMGDENQISMPRDSGRHNMYENKVEEDAG